jgi:hypothetical protein
LREQVHFQAMSLRCQRKMVSGVTMVATCFQGSPAKRFALGGASASLVIGEQYPLAAGFELFLQDPVLLDQVSVGQLKSRFGKH